MAPMFPNPSPWPSATVPIVNRTTYASACRTPRRRRGPKPHHEPNAVRNGDGAPEQGYGIHAEEEEAGDYAGTNGSRNWSDIGEAEGGSRTTCRRRIQRRSNDRPTSPSHAGFTPRLTRRRRSRRRQSHNLPSQYRCWRRTAAGHDVGEAKGEVGANNGRERRTATESSGCTSR